MRTLSLLASIVVLAVASFAACAEPQPAPMTTDARVTLKAYQGLVEEHLVGILRAEKALAVTSDAKSAKWENIKPALKRLSTSLGTDAAVWFALPDGGYYTAEGDRAELRLKDREYFPSLLAGQDVLGSLVVSKSTGHRSIIVATPVIDQGRIVGAIGVSVRTRLVSKLVEKNTGLPESMYFYALDANEQLAIHKNPDRIFKHPADIDPRLEPVFAPILKKDQGAFQYTLDGKPIAAIFNKSALTGWRFVLVQEQK
jgi:methyl-accepting chemotaxis protein